MDSRRNFFEEILAYGGLAALLAGGAEAQNKQSKAVPNADYDFWNTFYDTTRGVRKSPAGPAKDVRYLFSDNTGLRYVDQIKKEELLSHSGDTVINLTLGQFRPGTEDARMVKEFTSSQLRIDCVQTKPFMDLLAPLAWVALASLYTDKAGKLPSLQQLGAQAPSLMSGDNKVLLPGGAGKFSVNISSMSKESALHKILRQGVNIAGIAAPLMGFPGMSLPAAKTFTAIYTLLEEHKSYIISSSLIDAAATQQALERPGFPPQFIPLKTGEYVMIPRQHTDMLEQHVPFLEINQGYLIDKRKKSNLPVDQQAPQTLPDLTYATLKLTVTALNLATPVVAEPGLAGAEIQGITTKGAKKQ